MSEKTIIFMALKFATLIVVKTTIFNLIIKILFQITATKNTGRLFSAFFSFLAHLNLKFLAKKT